MKYLTSKPNNNFPCILAIKEILLPLLINLIFICEFKMIYSTDFREVTKHVVYQWIQKLKIMFTSLKLHCLEI